MNVLKRSNKNLVIALTGLLLAAIYGCKMFKVINSDYDRSIDFSQYHTYAWLPDKDNESSQYHNSIIHNNIKNYFSLHFAEFGYTADAENPDLLFEQVITTVNKSDNYTEQHPIATPPPPYNYQANPYYTPTPNPYNYNNSNNFNYNYNQQNYSNNGYAYRPPIQQYRTETHTQKYVETTFTLNAIDRKQNRLVWTCTVQADIYDNLYIESGIHPAVRSMIKTFPAKRLKLKKGSSGT